VYVCGALVRTDVSEESVAFFIVFLRKLLWFLVTANIFRALPILFTLIMETILSSETLVPTRARLRHIPEDGIHHSHRSENLRSYRALTGWTLLRICNVSSVKYELGFYIREYDILHSHRLENLKSYITITGRTLAEM
jgi:hypothetical protein